MMKKNTKGWIYWTFLALFLYGIGILELLVLGSIDAKACNFELDEGISWSSDGLYYMPAELISEGSNESKWVAFRGSNGMVYEVNDEILEQIGGSEGLSMDGVYLLTMDSNDTKEWYDDAILVVWRDVL